MYSATDYKKCMMFLPLKKEITYVKCNRPLNMYDFFYILKHIYVYSANPNIIKIENTYTNILLSYVPDISLFHITDIIRDNIRLSIRFFFFFTDNHDLMIKVVLMNLKLAVGKRWIHTFSGGI